MKMMKHTYIVIILAMIFGMSCSNKPQIKEEYIWPPAPSKPKIEYVKSISGSLDLKRSFWGKFKDFFLGGLPQIGIEKPFGIAKTKDSKLYIVDTAKKGILILETKSGEAKFYNSLGRAGSLIEPVYLIIDSENNIYVADSELGKIAVFDNNMNFLRFIGNDSDFVAPVGMAFNKDESVLYIVDTRDHKVKLFTKDGKYISSFGQRGDNKGEFHYPVSIKISRDTIYIVDSFHFAVQAFDLNGTYLFSFGPKAVGMGHLARPRDIAIDTNGYLYITDAVRNNVQIYTEKGELLLKFGEAGIRAGQFQLPAGIFIDEDNILYIADQLNKRVQVYRSLI